MNRIFFNIAMVALIAAAPIAALADNNCCYNHTACKGECVASDKKSDVYYIKDITPENIIKLYDLLGAKAEGKVGIKISTGESMKSHQLDPALIKDFVKHVNGTLIECNTAYAGNRNTTEAHLKAVKDHGYTAIAPVDIMDSEGEMEIPVANGKHIKKDIVGKHFADYDFVIVLSHFKGHQMGGFGGALKNISIGIASSNGKAYIHSAGKTADAAKIWQNTAEQDTFIESMADACKAVTDYKKGKMVYINVANNLSVDCDCNGNPADPKMKDFGILASVDPVALDRACVDMVFNSTDPGKADLIERIDSRHGALILPAAEALGVGTQNYNLITIE